MKDDNSVRDSILQTMEYSLTNVYMTNFKV